jgi:hypothetical protein
MGLKLLGVPMTVNGIVTVSAGIVPILSALYYGYRFLGAK